jgi:hypothetical protein
MEDHDMATKKFFVLYRIPTATVDDWRKNTNPAEMQAQTQKLMGEMTQWMQKHGKSFVERGSPLGKTKSVTSQGVAESRNDLNYYAIVEAESHEAAANLFADNPHLQIPTSSIEVMEIPHQGM